MPLLLNHFTQEWSEGLVILLDKSIARSQRQVDPRGFASLAASNFFFVVSSIGGMT